MSILGCSSVPDKVPDIGLTPMIDTDQILLALNEYQQTQTFSMNGVFLILDGLILQFSWKMW